MRRFLTLFVAVFAVGILAWRLSARGLTCPVELARRVVSGSSLQGIIRDGEEVLIEFGYYACRPVARGDIVAYRYGGNERPIIKIARGIPGDTLALESGESDAWYLVINGERVHDAAGKFYILDASQARMISLYVRDYGGVIPAESYLLLGSASAASLDSRQFGLAAKADILGRVRRR